MGKQRSRKSKPCEELATRHGTHEYPLSGVAAHVQTTFLRGRRAAEFYLALAFDRCLAQVANAKALRATFCGWERSWRRTFAPSLAGTEGAMGIFFKPLCDLLIEAALVWTLASWTTIIMYEATLTAIHAGRKGWALLGVVRAADLELENVKRTHQQQRRQV